MTMYLALSRSQYACLAQTHIWRVCCIHIRDRAVLALHYLLFQPAELDGKTIKFEMYLYRVIYSLGALDYNRV